MAYDDLLPGGTTSHLIEVFARDTATGQGKTGLAYSAITARYQRQGAAALTSITVVDGTLGTYVSGGWKELGSGWYQFGVPNAALAPGVGGVGISFHASGMIDISRRIVLTTSDLRVSTPAVAPGGNGGLATVDSSNRIAGIQGTKTTLDALQDLSQAQAQTAATASLTAYDPPTNAELEARTLASAGYATAAAQSSLATALSTLADKFAGITSVANWLRLLARKAGGDATALSELNSGGGTYNPATDSGEGQTDTGGAGLTAEAVRQAVWVDAPSRTLTQTAAEIAAALEGSALVIRRGDLYDATLTSVVIPADAVKVWLTAKRSTRDTDDQAVLQIEAAAGLLRLNGAAPTDPELASLTVDAEAETLRIRIDCEATADLSPGERVYDVQYLDADGQTHTATASTAEVTADVTRATS